MPVTGLYINHRVRDSIIPYVKAYRNCVLRDVVPVFANLSDRANAIADAEFRRLGQIPAGEDCDGDMSLAADAAHGKGQVFYDTMDSVRQATLNLFTAGLFHLLEQQLADLCCDGAFDIPPKDTKLEIVAKWYRSHFDLDLSKLPSWPKIDELRLLANSVKHGEGRSALDLRAIRPDLFQDPAIRKYFPDLGDILQSSQVRLPMSGEDIFVTKEVFSDFGEAAVRFITEIADYFASHKNELYPVSS